MKFEVTLDLKRIGYGLVFLTLALTGIGGIGFMMHEIIRLAPAPAPDSQLLAQKPHEEAERETVYLDLPNAKPKFLDRDEILKKRDALIWEKRDFVVADLADMLLTTHQRGIKDESYPIVATGTAGSFFEIPSGLYAVQSKTPMHRSKISNANFPAVLHLFGNYFIHGAVSRAHNSAETTGSVALSPEDARKIFNAVSEGTPVLVFNNTAHAEPEFSYVRKNNLPHRVPEVTAAAVLATDLETGTILFEKNKQDAFPIASVTKLMTAAIATETIPTSTPLTVSQEALNTYGNSAGLTKGEVFSAAKLLYGLILPSSNDAARMYELAKDNFLAAMNQKAEGLGMTHTRYADSSGLSKESISSASDLFKLLRYIADNHPDILEVSRYPQYATVSEAKNIRHVWRNVNWPSGDSRFLGGKAGWTEDSLQTMVGIYGINPSEYGGRRIAVVVLGSRDRVRDTRAIIRYIEQGFIYGGTLVRK